MNMNSSVRIYRKPHHLVLQSAFRFYGLPNVMFFFSFLGWYLTRPTMTDTTTDIAYILVFLMTLLFVFCFALFSLVFQLKYHRHVFSPEVQVLSDGLQVKIWYYHGCLSSGYPFEHCIPWDTIQNFELKVLSWLPGKPACLKFTTGKNQWVESPWPLENLADFQQEIAQYVPADHPLLQFVSQWQAEHPEQKKLIESKFEKA